MLFLHTSNLFIMRTQIYRLTYTKKSTIDVFPNQVGNAYNAILFVLVITKLFISKT